MLKNAKPVRVSMLFEQINEGVWARAYLIVDETSKSAVLVDPVIEFGTMATLVSPLGSFGTPNRIDISPR